MNKEFVFISDFDGTITEKDFYWHIIDKYLKEEGMNLYKRWRQGEFNNIEFISTIFQNIGQDENQIYKDIIEIPMDSYIKDFIDFIHSLNGEFVIVSAGSSYYIELFLRYYGINNIKVYSNYGIYKDKGIHLELDPTYEFYSERYGLDKKKVVQYLKGLYPKLYYAGDSSPDYEASLLCDCRFAKGRLIQLYKKNSIDYVAFETFKDIRKIIEDYLNI
ncbi:MAG: MtnX-like HAD-IB family phosphatase [Epulopiscium sp.]|nr:MtnX-like HAD-IB family phosphatase [Candidatus Epulonipiscium sp.]